MKKVNDAMSGEFCTRVKKESEEIVLRDVLMQIKSLADVSGCPPLMKDQIGNITVQMRQRLIRCSRS